MGSVAELIDLEDLNREKAGDAKVQDGLYKVKSRKNSNIHVIMIKDGRVTGCWYDNGVECPSWGHRHWCYHAFDGLNGLGTRVEEK